MKLGLSTLCFRDRPLDRELLQIMRQAGVESVELTDYHPGFSYDEPAGFAELKSVLSELGLELNSLHIHLEKSDPKFDLATLMASQREKALAAYRRAVDLMAALGGGILVTHDIRIPEPLSGAAAALGVEKRSAFLDNFRQIAGYAESAQVRLALENTSRGYTRDPARLVALIEDLDVPNVGICIDTGHRNLVGDPVAALRSVGSHLCTLHIHDNRGQRDEHLLPGGGNIAWQDIAQALDQIGYGGVFMYELNRTEDLSALRRNFEDLLKQRSAG